MNGINCTFMHTYNNVIKPTVRFKKHEQNGNIMTISTNILTDLTFGCILKRTYFTFATKLLYCYLWSNIFILFPFCPCFFNRIVSPARILGCWINLNSLHSLWNFLFKLSYNIVGLPPPQIKSKTYLFIQTYMYVAVFCERW